MKVFLAGTSGEINNKEVVQRSPYILESYYYIKPWQYDLIHSSKMFLMDSGAFTFFSAGKNIDWHEYVREYAKFIVEHDVRYFIELDIDVIIGYENVLKLRSELESLTGRKSIPVWHINRGKEDFVEMCRKYDYVAIGGLVGFKNKNGKQSILEDSFPWFIEQAHRNGAQIHALGYTKTQTLTKYHFDSVDSTRWNCSRFGRLEYFDGKTIKPIDKRKLGKKLKGGESRFEIMNFTFGEWIKFQNYADNHL